MPPGTQHELVLANLATIRDAIARSCDRAGREPRDVLIVAAAKTVDAERIRWVRDAGVRDVGENYLRELRAKREQVAGLVWHFLGTLQSHTAHQVAELADVVETAVPGRPLDRLARRAFERGRTLPVLVEVDLAGRGNAVAPEAVADAADEVAETDGIALAGLMTLPPIPSRPEDSRPHFRRLRSLLAAVAERHPEANQISMGMSLDYTVAVEEGATMVRIGTALFGARPPVDQGRT
jgi:hypothetical protein